MAETLCGSGRYPPSLVLRIKQMIHRLRLDTATCLGLTRID